MAGLCDTAVAAGDSIAQWPRDNAGVPHHEVQELLQLVGRRHAHAVLLREISVAAGGVSRRNQHQRDRDVCQEVTMRLRSHTRMTPRMARGLPSVS